MPGSLNSVRHDPQALVEGVWWENYLGHGFDIRVASWMNERHASKLAELVQAARADGHDLTDDEWWRIEGEAIAHGVWTDARHLVDDDGSPVDYSPELGAETLNNREFFALRRNIIQRAQQDDRYLVGAVGNSGAASAGS